MDLQQLFQILKMKYGAFVQVASEASVTTQTVRTVLLGGSATPEVFNAVLVAAKRNAAEILNEQQLEAEDKIQELQTSIQQLQQLRGQLAA